MASKGKSVLYCSGKYKAVAVPYGESAAEVVSVTDFAQYKSVPLTDSTEMFMRYDCRNFHLRVVCHEESGQIDSHVSDSGSQIWNGSDRLELFFGAVEPVPWLMQLAVSANGHRFDSTGEYSCWQAEVTVGEKMWQAEITIPLDMLRLQNLSCGFNIARMSHGDRKISLWSRMEKLFHEFENYGQLFFCDYQNACLARLGICSPESLTRSSFEKMVTEHSLPAEQIIHGPWLSNPECTAMTVSFGTAGYAGAFVDYREKGQNDWMRSDCQRCNGVLARNRKIHVCCLEGLKPGTEYEYRAVALKPVTLTEAASGIFSFRSNPCNAVDFSFIMFSDIHSNAGHVRDVMALKEAAQSDFLVNLGDYLSCTSGPDGYYDAFLDIQSENFGREHPLVFVRGNHEQIGIFSDLVNEIMPHPSGRSYYSFMYSDVMFVALDPGNDHDDDSSGICRNRPRNAEQRQWLEKLTETEEFQQAAFRVCLVHFPPQGLERYDSQVVIGLIQNIDFDLMLCGHEHRYFSIPPMAGVCEFKRTGEKGPETVRLPYPVVANDTDTFLQIIRKGREIITRAVTAEGQQIDKVIVRR